MESNLCEVESMIPAMAPVADLENWELPGQESLRCGGRDMKIDFLEDSDVRAMGNYMARLSQRLRLVASNLANIDTPGYKTKDISFHATMEELLAENSMPFRATQPEHRALGEWSFAPVQPEVFEVQGLPARPDKNNVDLDKEMLKLAETSFVFSMMSQFLRAKFHKIASAINDGRTGQ